MLTAQANFRGYVLPWAAVIIGIVGSLVVYLVTFAKAKVGSLLILQAGLDDPLDSFTVHGIGGVIGTLMNGRTLILPTPDILNPVMLCLNCTPNLRSLLLQN